MNIIKKDVNMTITFKKQKHNMFDTRFSTKTNFSKMFPHQPPFQNVTQTLFSKSPPYMGPIEAISRPFWPIYMDKKKRMFGAILNKLYSIYIYNIYLYICRLEVGELQPLNKNEYDFVF